MKRIARYFRRTALLPASAVLSFFLSTPASFSAQQTTCGQRGEMELALAARYGEMPFSTATAGYNLVKFYVNPSTRSWTAIAVTPDGGACILAAGDNFEPTSKSDAKILGPAS